MKHEERYVICGHGYVWFGETMEDVERRRTLAEKWGQDQGTLYERVGHISTQPDTDDDELLRYRQFIFDRGLAKEFGMYEMPQPAEDEA